MFCKKCGARLDDNAYVCPNCKEPTGISPQVNKGFAVPTAQPKPAPQPKPVKQPKPAKQPKPKKQKPPKDPKKANRIMTKIILVILALLVIVSAALVLLIHFDVIDSPFEKTSNSKKAESTTVSDSADESTTQASETTTYIDTHTADDFKVDPIDADEYYNENGDVREKIKASDSDTVQSGADAVKDLKSRGFEQNPVGASFDIDGNPGEAEVEDTDTAEYPMYQTYYTAENGDVWLIISVNGSVYAYPMTYNIDLYYDEVPVVVSETETVISFDNATATFYESVPNEDVMRVKVVKKINAKTLDEIDLGALDYEE